MKKAIALLLALVMVFALCACGGGTDTKKDDSNSASKVDTSTVSVGAVVIARDDVPTDQIYAFVSTIFNNLDAIAAQHGKGAELNLEAAASVKGVPYHPGAAKYFEEKGVKVDAVKDGAGTGTAAALNFGTGGDTGTYYGFGSVLANYVSTNSDCKVTALTSGGSQANVEDLANGNVQLAFVQSDVMNYAYNGQRLFENPVTGFSVVAQLYQEQVQIVTTNPDIKTVADLAGKKVSIGAAGSGVYFNAIDVLNAYDLKESDISAVYQSFGDSAESLKDGKIDAAFIVAGAPTTAIMDLSTTKAAYLVSLDDAHIDELLAASPYYTKHVIPAGTYNGQDEDVTTVAVGAVILARDDVSEDAIYALTADIFDNAPDLISSHAKYGELSTEFGASITSVPYHPGAAKYFAEKGFDVATK